MDLINRISQHAADAIEIQHSALNMLAPQIAHAAERLVQSLMADAKVLSCGNGSAAALSQLFTSSMLNRLEKERPGLAAYALTPDSCTLTAIANDYDHDLIFSKQVRALGQSHDILLTICTNGSSANVIEAIHAAHERQMTVIALTGGDGGQIGDILTADDIPICVPAERAMRVQEVHLLILHCLCDAVDCMLLGVE